MYGRVKSLTPLYKLTMTDTRTDGQKKRLTGDGEMHKGGWKMHRGGGETNKTEGCDGCEVMGLMYIEKFT